MTRISFIGDISFNDAYNELYEKKINPFHQIEAELSESDLVVGNLECTAKGNKGFNLLKKPRLSTNPETLGYLKNIHLGAASLATNHVYDNLNDGFKKTIDYLNSQNIMSLGCSRKKEDVKKSLLFEKNKIKFCFLNYVTTDTNLSLPVNAEIYPNIFSVEQCLNDLKENENADYRILLLHWGGIVEGGLYPIPDQAALAKILIENGADLIIGHHSHTFQPFEKIKGKYVFYSLGNFCFADIYSDGKKRSMSARRMRESAIVHIDFFHNGYKIKLSPIKNKDLYISSKNIVLWKIKWRNFVFHLLKKINFCWKFYIFYHRFVSPVITGVFRIDNERSFGTRIKEFHLTKIISILKK